MWKLSWVLLILCSCAQALPGYQKRYMNLSASPCRDFYAYACGGWSGAHESRDYSSQVEQLDHLYHGQLRALLEQEAPATEPRFVQLVRNNYAACRQLRENYAAAGFVRMLREWMSPNIGKVDQEGDWTSMTPLLRVLVKFGRLNYFKWGKEDGDMLEVNDAEQWLQKLQLFWPHIGSDSVEWQGDEADFLPLTHEQFTLLYRALQPLDVPQEVLWHQVNQLEEQLWNVTQYEELLVDLPDEEEENKKRQDVEHQISQLKQQIVNMDKEEENKRRQEEQEQLVEMLKAQFKLQRELAAQQLEMEKFQKEEKTLLSEFSMAPNNEFLAWLLPVPIPLPLLPEYLANLPSVLLAQPRKLLQHYLLLRLLHKLQQMPPLHPSSLECAAQTRLLLPHAADWLLEQQLSQEQRLQRRHHVKRLFAQLRQQFKQQLLANRNDFNKVTQRFLLDKVRRMRLRLGLLPTGEQQPLLGPAEEQQLLELHYAPLQLNASDYFGNLLAILRQHQVWTEQGTVETLRNRRALLLVPPLDFGTFASPFFMPSGNLLVLPPSLFAPPIYQAHQAELYRLSSLGFFMAHEMSHSLAPSNMMYDGRGTALTVYKDNIYHSDRFSNQLLCMHFRYRNLKRADEKFADLNGIALAYKAYLATTTATQQQQQRFFINFAQLFCRAKQQPQLEIDHHGSNRRRVNEAVASLEGFASAFGCARDEANSHCELY